MKNLRLTILAILAIAALALVLTGCGGDSSEKSGDTAADEPAQAKTLTKAELISQGDKLCRKMQKDSQAVDGAADPDTPEDLADSVGKMTNIYKDTLAELKALAPPEELADDYQAWLDANDKLVEMYDQMLEIAENDDQDAAAALQPKMEDQFAELDRLSKKVGFKVCTRE